MFVLSIVALIIGAISATLAVFEPSTDELRVRQARRRLRQAGIAAPEGSEAEARALRAVLDGDEPRNV